MARPTSSQRRVRQERGSAETPAPEVTDGPAAEKERQVRRNLPRTEVGGHLHIFEVR